MFVLRYRFDFLYAPTCATTMLQNKDLVALSMHMQIDTVFSIQMKPGEKEAIW